MERLIHVDGVHSMMLSIASKIGVAGVLTLLGVLVIFFLIVGYWISQQEIE